jgi:DNA-binding LacI/PurR family transcriptional regulator
VKKRVTVYDLAGELGLSASTVSRVLNNSVLVGDQTRDLILRTARRLGYRKRVIRKQKNRAILNIRLFLPAARFAYLHLFYDTAELIGGLHEGFGELRINIIIRLNDNAADSRDSKKLGGIDGTVFAFTEPAARAARTGIPAILINRQDSRRCHVALDDRAGMQRLLEAVAQVRPRLRPCFIGFRPVAYINRRRREGFLDAAGGLGIPAPAVFEFETLADITGRFLRRQLDAGCDSFFCLNDVVAAWVHSTAQREGIRFPADAALTGFDNSPVLDLVPQRIDTIDLSVREMARRAGSWLQRRIMERRADEEHTIFAGAYVAGQTIADRGSCHEG